MNSPRVVLDILKECFTVILNTMISLFIKFLINITVTFSLCSWQLHYTVNVMSTMHRVLGDIF